MIWIIAALLVLWVIGSLALDAPPLRQFDQAAGEVFDSHPDDKTASQNFLKHYREMNKRIATSMSYKKGMQIARDFADNLSVDLEATSEFTPITINGMKAEWTLAPGINKRRRVLMLHGGAFAVGTPKGHRHFTERLSILANAAVLCIDYRLAPENGRMRTVEDAQTAYRWILDNGPDAKNEVKTLIIAGDSAGGNLALMLSNWSRNQQLRQADAVIGFSPSLDTTLSSPTIKRNRKTDVMLRKIGNIALLPKALYLVLGALIMRANPSNPLVSPLFDRLDNLPPTLIHASSSEILLGDAIRYTNKARAAGSEVTLQIWKDQMHDWHIFHPSVGSGVKAWNQVAKFLNRF